jgi:hypothetical protein
LASYFQRWLFLGEEAQITLVQLFQQTVKSVPPAILRARIDSMRSHIIAGRYYIRFSQFTVKDIKGPHFLLQAKPQACAAAIIEAVTWLRSQ